MKLQARNCLIIIVQNLSNDECIIRDHQNKFLDVYNWQWHEEY
jgi:hypothetical protein